LHKKHHLYHEISCTIKTAHAAQTVGVQLHTEN